MPSPNNQPYPQYRWQRPNRPSLPGYFGGQGATFLPQPNHSQFRCYSEGSDVGAVNDERRTDQTAPETVPSSGLQTFALSRSGDGVPVPEGIFSERDIPFAVPDLKVHDSGGELDETDTTIERKPGETIEVKFGDKGDKRTGKRSDRHDLGGGTVVEVFVIEHQHTKTQNFLSATGVQFILLVNGCEPIDEVRTVKSCMQCKSCDKEGTVHSNPPDCALDLSKVNWSPDPRKDKDGKPLNDLKAYRASGSSKGGKVVNGKGTQVGYSDFPSHDTADNKFDIGDFKTARCASIRRVGEGWVFLYCKGDYLGAYYWSLDETVLFDCVTGKVSPTLKLSEPNPLVGQGKTKNHFVPKSDPEAAKAADAFKEAFNGSTPEDAGKMMK